MTAPTESPADRIAEIRARAGAATPGPWATNEDRDYVLDEGGRGIARGYFARRVNLPFIAHARTDVPWLLDEVERLRGQIDATRQMLRIECAEFDDNDWPDDLHLADVVEKHLAKSAHAEIERLRKVLQGILDDHSQDAGNLYWRAEEGLRG